MQINAFDADTGSRLIAMQKTTHQVLFLPFTLMHNLKYHQRDTHLLSMLDVESLLSVVSPGDSCQPVQIVARHVELTAGRLKVRKLGHLLIDDSPSFCRDALLVGLYPICKPATDSGREIRRACSQGLCVVLYCSEQTALQARDL